MVTRAWAQVYLFVSLVTLGAPLARADCDTSTDAGVAAAYEKATGKAADKRCIRRSTTFPGIVTIGSFAYDRGCADEGILVGCKWKPADAAATAMAGAGWAKGDAALRQKLALAWLEEVDGFSFLESEPKNFAKSGKKFAPVKATVSDKTLALELWVREPPGMRNETVYVKYKVVFAADGAHGTLTQVDQAVSPG